MKQHAHETTNAICDSLSLSPPVARSGAVCAAGLWAVFMQGVGLGFHLESGKRGFVLSSE